VINVIFFENNYQYQLLDNKILEIFIPGPAGRLEAKYFKSKKSTSPIALVLQPHPQYGGTMNNKVGC
tara:strand:+ start:247 stop:447 length:201 start_codon:yes stop_codon:yes gene_type:complete